MVMATRIGTGPTGTTRTSAGAVMSAYDHDDAALVLRWAIRRADDSGDPVPCRGQQMIGAKLPIIRVLVCADCPLYLKRACAEFGIAVLRSNRARTSMIAGGHYLVNQRDADALAEELARQDEQALAEPVAV